MSNVNWIQEIRQMKHSTDEDLTVTFSWKNKTVTTSRKPIAHYSADREDIRIQFVMLARMESIVKQYKKSLRDNYGQLFLTLAEEYSKESAKVPHNAALVSHYVSKMNKLADEICEQDAVDEENTTRILIEEELDNICQD